MYAMSYDIVPVSYEIYVYKITSAVICGPRTAFASAMPATIEKYELIFQACKCSTKDELSTIGINVCVFLRNQFHQYVCSLLLDTVAELRTYQTSSNCTSSS